MRIIIIFLVIILVGLQYKLWVGDGSVSELFSLKKKLVMQNQHNRLLVARNRALAADILELKSGDQALEEQAKFELGMVKEGEVYFQFIDKN